MIPGPVSVEDRVLEALARPVRAHYGDAWTHLFKRAVAGMREVFKTTGEVHLVFGSGMAGVEMCVASVLSRADVRAQLEAFGVNPTEVKARLAALTDDEAAQLARQIDSLPAGADGGATLLGIAIIVVAVLIITDLLGVTHIFPFIKPIR